MAHVLQRRRASYCSWWRPYCWKIPDPNRPRFDSYESIVHLTAYGLIVSRGERPEALTTDCRSRRFMRPCYARMSSRCPIVFPRSDYGHYRTRRANLVVNWILVEKKKP